MKIDHGFGFRAHDLISLFDKTNKVSTFMTKLEKQSTLDVQRYDPNKYKGDGFEFLVEILLKSHAYDNRLGITNYEPVQTSDNGVDGVGYNLSDNKSVLTANEDKLGNLISDGMIQHGVSLSPQIIESIKNKKLAPSHYVITTASGLHHYTDSEFFKGVVHCIGYEQLRSMLDNNLSFWNLCRKICQEIENSKIKKP
jgi:hypothetical protein